MILSVSRRISALAIFLVLLVAGPAMAAFKVQEVTSPKGVTAWLVEDYSVPIITLRFSFSGGSSQDPAGKEGVANLMTSLFDEGAGDLDSDAFQEKLEDTGAEMSFSADADSISGSFRMLADNRDESLAMLRLAINETRFDAAPVDRMRDQLIAGILAESKEPSTIARIAWNEKLYAGHPYGRRADGTAETLAKITSDDLKAFRQAQFARSNLHVGVVGAIDAATLAKVLDDLFGALPEKPEQADVGPVDPEFGQELTVPYDLPQTTIQLAFPGIKRSDPEFYAAYLMNHILGGGSFTSRLYFEVREKRGLAYGVYSYLVTREHSNILQIATSTRADRAAESLSIILDEVKKMATEGPTEAELEEAKKFVINSYAVSNFTSSGSIAETLVGVQEQKLGITYFEDREKFISAVTLDDVKAVAVRLLSAKPVVMLVGPKA